MTTDEAVAVLKNPQSTEAEQLAAWDHLHPLASSGQEPPRDVAPPAPPARLRLASLPAPPAPSSPAPAPAPVTLAAPPPPAAPPAPVAPGIKPPALRIILGFGAAIRFNTDETGPVFQVFPRLEATVFDSVAAAEAAAAPLRALAVVSIDPLTKVEMNQLTNPPRPSAARGQRLVTAPPPAPRPAPVKYGEKFIVIVDDAPLCFPSTMTDFRCEVVSRLAALAFAVLNTSGYIPRLMQRGMVLDGRTDLLTEAEAAASQPKVRLNALSGCKPKPQGPFIVLANGAPVCFTGDLYGFAFEKCDRLEATQFPSQAAAIANMNVNSLKHARFNVEYSELSAEEFAASHPRQPPLMKFEGKSKCFVGEVMVGLTRPHRRSDDYAHA